MPKPMSDLPENHIMPDPALEKRSRRKFTAEYKLRIMAEADSCKHGELGSLLRKEKLYRKQLSDWRQDYAEQGVSGLNKSAPGPSPSKTLEQKQYEQLEKENRRLKRKLEIANDCLELQKKALSMYENLSSGSNV